MLNSASLASEEFIVMKRRAFLGGLSAVSIAGCGAQSATAVAQNAVSQTAPEPLVWPVVARLQPSIRAFAGHTDTVPDIVGRIGTPPSLVIFTEGNHMMVLLSDDIVGAFPSWAKSRPQYADLELDNIIVVTVPQPVVVQMIRTGGIALGNLTLDVTRRSGFYPDIVMAGPAPLRELRKLGAIEPQARYFSKNRGFALLVRKGNPLAIHGLTDVARTGARIALPDAREAGARARYRAAVEDLIGKSAADTLLAAEAPDFPGRIGIVHRDLPEMVARGYADVALTQYHLVSYWTRIFPNHFQLEPVAGAERFFVNIALARSIDPMRPRAVHAFEEFFFSRAREIYPRYDFAPMSDVEYGATLTLA
jgi:Bacterial extracellular solute-binding protein